MSSFLEFTLFSPRNVEVSERARKRTAVYASPGVILWCSITIMMGGLGFQHLIQGNFFFGI